MYLVSINMGVKRVTLELERAPLYLRVVTKGVQIDALDQLDDQAEPGEQIAVYKRGNTTGVVHVSRTVKRRRVGSWYRTVDYEFLPEQPADEVMRDNVKWQEWARARFAVEFPGATIGPDGSINYEQEQK